LLSHEGYFDTAWEWSSIVGKWRVVERTGDNPPILGITF
jgi:hypothetical protein